MQAKDDHDHAVFIHTARDERAFVMDPLGRGRYQGHWIAKVDLRQFASRFTTSSGSPYCAVVKRGEESRIERVRRQVRERTRSLRAELATAKAAVTTARRQALRDAEPALTASFLAAVLLAIAARYLGLTDEDLAILGPVMLIVAGVVIRAGVFAPDTVRDLLDDEDAEDS